MVIELQTASQGLQSSSSCSKQDTTGLLFLQLPCLSMATLQLLSIALSISRKPRMVLRMTNPRHNRISVRPLTNSYLASQRNEGIFGPALLMAVEHCGCGNAQLSFKALGIKARAHLSAFRHEQTVFFARIFIILVNNVTSDSRAHKELKISWSPCVVACCELNIKLDFDCNCHPDLKMTT